MIGGVVNYYIKGTMKKIILWGICAACLICSGTVLAQEGKDRKGVMRREQMMEKRAEGLADELELKGDARSEFLVTYKNYQQDLAAHRKASPFPAGLGGKKESEMTEEEAAERIKTEFDRKAQQIVDAYNTLEVDKKYYEVFSKTMSAKQLMKIFVPTRKMNARNGGRQSVGKGGDRLFGVPNGFPQNGFEREADW